MSTTMSAEQLTAIHRRYSDEVVNGGKLDLIDTIFAPDYAGHVGAGQELHGIDGARAFVESVRAAFPDAQFTIDDRIIAGNKLAVRWTVQGTHHGTFAGVPATGKRVNMSGLALYRFEGDKIQEGWDYADAVTLLQQLGALP